MNWDEIKEKTGKLSASGSYRYSPLVCDEEGSYDGLRTEIEQELLQHTTEMVSIQDLRTDQPANKEATLRAMHKDLPSIEELRTAGNPIVVIDTDGKYKLLDGNTRTVLAQAYGEIMIGIDLYRR